MPSFIVIRRAALSVLAGSLFGLAISTSAPAAHSAAAGVGAAAFVYGAYQRFERTERRSGPAEAGAETGRAADGGDGDD